MARRGFCAALYSWGPNIHNLGRSCALWDDHNLPAPVAAALAAPLRKAVSGFSESLLLTEQGQLYAYGHPHVLAANAPAPRLYQTNVADADVDATHAAFLFGDGTLVVDARGRQRLFKGLAPARKVACGAGETLVVVPGADCDQLHGFQLAGDGREFHRGYRLERLNALLRERRARVADLQLAKAAGAMLLADGSLHTWGANQHGNLGVPSSLLRQLPQQLYQPKEPLRCAGVAGAAAGFALSCNVLAVLTADGRALFCGFEDVFLLREIRLPEGEAPARVCAWESNFAVITERGAVYVRRNFPDDPRPARYFGDLDLYRVGPEYFGGRKLASIGGKYGNPIAVAV